MLVGYYIIRISLTINLEQWQNLEKIPDRNLPFSNTKYEYMGRKQRKPFVSYNHVLIAFSGFCFFSGFPEMVRSLLLYKNSSNYQLKICFDLIA